MFAKFTEGAIKVITIIFIIIIQIHLYTSIVFKWIKFVKRISFNHIIKSYINQILIISMFAKFTKVAIHVIMLTQEKHVLPAMTHRKGGHSTTNVSATVHRDNFYSLWKIIYQNTAEKIFYLDKP